MTRLSESLHPAYHLRPNKAVDRFLFLELLRILERHGSAFPETYIGLGGPFMEDFRLLSQEFPHIRLVCIERDFETHRRQKFHACTSRMVCIHSTLSSYIARSFPSERPVAVWADYTDMTRECLGELADISRKAVPGSVIRATVRAESPWGGALKTKYPPSAPAKYAEAFRKERTKHETGMTVDGIAFDPAWFGWAEFSLQEYPTMLARMIGAVVSGACTRPKTFLPLHVVKYSDGTVMLSVTGLVCHEDARAGLQRHFRECFRFLSEAIDDVDVIDVPALTTKERLHLDSAVPTSTADGSVCAKRLQYLVEGDGSAVESRRKMAQYERYYRLYPYFGKLEP